VTEPGAIDPSSTAAPPAQHVPGVREIVSRSLDLNLAASSDVRRTAVLIGLLTLAVVGPLVAVVLAIGTRPGGFDWLLLLANGYQPRQIPLDPAAGMLFLVVLAIGAGGLTALSVDSQLLAVIVIASRAIGRTFELRPALQISRMRFWPLLRANVLIGLILLIPNRVVEQVVSSGRQVTTESQLVILTIIGVVLSVPFAYVSAWIILGPVGARESVRRSWRLARRRLRLALVIAAVNTAVATLAGFAIGTGVDVLYRVATFLGVADSGGIGSLVVLLAIVAAGIVALGSLTMTIAALTAGPQVVAFLGLTGVTNGLAVVDDPDNPFATPRVEPLVSTPMKVAIAVAVIAGALAVVLQLT
jgi:hypothetical protein